MITRSYHRWNMRHLLFFAALFHESCLASYTVVLPPNQKECYQIPVYTDQSVQLSGNFDCFEVTEEEVRACRSIAAWISNQEGHLVWESKVGNSEELFFVKAQGRTKYELCFECNTDTDHTDAVNFELGFNVRVVHSVRSLPEDELGPDAQRAMELLDTSRENEQQWQNLLDHFDFLRNREAMHRQLSASINSRVMSWTILEACLVITMAVLQVWYWKTFFEQRRFL